MVGAVDDMTRKHSEKLITEPDETPSGYALCAL